MKIIFLTTLLAGLLIPFLGWTQYQPRMQYQNRLGDSVVLRDKAEKPIKEKKPKILTHSMSGGFRLNSNGWGLFMNFAFLYGNDEFGAINRNKYFQNKFLELSFGEILTHKEIKTGDDFNGVNFAPASFKLGKINNFYRLNIGYGYRHLIAGKPEKGTVAIHWVYMGGLSLGLVKPYYLDILNRGEIRYNDSLKNDFLNPSIIMGKGGFFKGWSDVKVVPGVFLRSGLHFDFSIRKKGLMAIETGAQAAYYTKKVDIMIDQKPKDLVFNLYFSIQFGGLW